MKIKIGDRIPSFSLKDQNNKLIDIDSFQGKEKLVIFFYPKDESPGCTAQACAFRDAYQDFTDHGATVIGISSDSEESHKKFKDHHQLPFILFSDPDGKIRKLFGVPKSMLGILPGRVTYVTDKDLVVQHIFNSQLKIEKHIEESLEVIRKIN